jgi:hypothetical protein
LNDKQPYSREQLEYLQQFDRMTHLRDMRHSQGWEIFAHMAEQKIQQLMAGYIKEDSTREQAFDNHLKLRAVMDFWANLREVVENASNFCDPAEVAVALYSLSQEPDLS